MVLQLLGTCSAVGAVGLVGAQTGIASSDGDLTLLVRTSACI